MLIIRESQLEVFRQHARRRLEAHLLHMVQVSYPNIRRSEGEDGCRVRIAEALDDGASHGLRLDSSLTCYLRLRLEFGDRFERSSEQAWALALLAQPSLPGPAKIRAIDERLRAATGGRRVRVAD